MKRALLAIFCAIVLGTAAGARAQAPSGPCGERLAAARSDFLRADYGRALLQIDRVIAADPACEEAAALRREIAARMPQIRPVVATDAAPAAAPRLRAWIGLEVGHDSNVNSGTDATEIRVPLLRVTPSGLQETLADLRRRSSGLAGLIGGGELLVPVTEASHLRVSGAAAGRFYPEVSEYLPHHYQLSAEFGRRWERTDFSVSATTSHRRIGGHRLIDANSLSSEIGLRARPGVRVALFGTHADKLHPLFDDLRSRQNQAGLSAALPARGVLLALYAGSERALGPDRQLDRDFLGFVAEWIHPLSAASRLRLAYHHLSSDFVQFGPVFLVNRADTLHEATLSYDRELGGGWHVTPKVILQHNASNIGLTRFTRTQWLFELRKEY